MLRMWFSVSVRFGKKFVCGVWNLFLDRFVMVFSRWWLVRWLVWVWIRKRFIVVLCVVWWCVGLMVYLGYVLMVVYF